MDRTFLQFHLVTPYSFPYEEKVGSNPPAEPKKINDGRNLIDHLQHHIHDLMRQNQLLVQKIKALEGALAILEKENGKLKNQLAQPLPTSYEMDISDFF